MPSMVLWKWALHLRSSRLQILSLTAVVALFLGGCGTLENGRGWGEDALWPLDWDRIARAGRDALCDPGTWVPAVGALVFSIDDFDERVSDWAVEHNPIFGTENGADNASNYLSTVLGAEVLATALATPSGDTPGVWLPSKLKGLTVEAGALWATAGLTDLLKGAAGRERPDDSDDKSFPSGHTSHAFACATLANRNLEFIDSLDGIRPVLQIGNTILASGVAWARVEARKHYPSDVLAGAALGHFLTAFIHDAFLNLPEDGSIDFSIYPMKGGAGLELCFRF
jgi:membrane-associated phospholipid phosphatase